MQPGITKKSLEMSEIKSIISPPDVGAFEIEALKSGEVIGIRSFGQLWEILERESDEKDTLSFKNFLKQVVKKPLSSVIFDTIKFGNLSFFGSFSIGASQKHLKLDFFCKDIADEAVFITGTIVDLSYFQEVCSHYREVLDASKAYTWKLNLQVNEATFSPNYVEHASHGPGSLKISLDDWIAVLHPDDVKNATKALLQLKSGEKKQTIVEYRRKGKLGNWIWLRVHAGVSRYDFLGKPQELKGISFNITAEYEKE